MVTGGNLALAACPHCGTLNRLAAAKLRQGAGGVCGRCQADLFTGASVTLSAANFARFAEQSDLPLLIDFWAGWCAPCRQMAPQFEAAARLLEPQVRLAKVDADQQPDIARRFSIRSIPTLVLVRKGRELARISGALQAETIRAWAQRALLTGDPYPV
jgi:thioredoxin 2